jgi:hypothetical protein
LILVAQSIYSIEVRFDRERKVTDAVRLTSLRRALADSVSPSRW